ncbi:MAG: peptidylprolyl isomerase [Patescibacteria group bacterium]|jgi:cyclophilin family peptidyl-prolyl cis-trans isomerase
MKKFIFFSVIIIILIGGYFLWPKKTIAPAKNEDNQQQITNENKESKVSTYQFPGALDQSQIADKKAVIKTTKGTIEFTLYADKAPKTVSNFVYLADQKYYDGLIFHRVVPNFVIQGGDPTGTGSGGPGYKFPDEPVVGEYLAGTVAMANSGPDTNGSQFFICLEDQPSLPKSYSLFGQVTGGMDVVKNIAVGDKMDSVTIENIK